MCLTIPYSIDDDDMNGFMNAVHTLDKERGLDLVLHTPGGSLAATESIVHYLMDSFNHDVCAIVPHLAMSAGTMMACACKSVLMGRQSSLGPVDPQLRGLPVGGVIEEFEQAVAAAKTNPNSIPIWAQIIAQYTPTFLGDCQKALEASRLIVHDWLLENMLGNDSNAGETADCIVNKLCEHEASGMHDRHFSYSTLEQLGMHVELMEKNDVLQDAILSVHHSFMATFQRGNVAKIIQSSNNRFWMVSGTE